MKITVLGLFLLCYCGIFSAFGQQRQIDGIDITSTWGGLGQPQKSQLAVVRRGSKYISNGKKIDPAKIDALLKALEEPTISKPSLDNLGITETTLRKNAQICVETCINGYIARANPDQKQLFISKYTDTMLVEEQVEGMFNGGWTDDYPFFEMRIRLNDGGEVEVSSDSQSLFMIPWKIDDKSSIRKTFNSHISAAILSIISPKFTNGRRMVGEGLYEDLARSIMRFIEPEWKRLDVLAQVKDAVNIFEKEYEIVSMEINSNHDSDFGTPWNTGEPIEKNLHIVLRTVGFPKGFAIKLILPVVNGKVQNIEIFQYSISSYLDLVNSVPWIKHFVDNSEKSVWLRFVKYRSFSQKGMRSFAADMKALGKADLAAEVEKVQDKVVVLSLGGGLEYYQSFWLILPDGRSVVWRHYYVTMLPEIKFTGSECVESRSNTKPCVGALISRDGKVLAM